VGWLWFLVMILPVVGIIQVGDQWMADRYTYLPLLGLVFAAGMECSCWVGGKRWRVVTATVTGAAAVALLVWLTRQQLPYWKDDASMSARAIAMGGNHWTMRTNQAIALSRSGDLKAALKEFEAIHRDFPHDHEGLNNLAFCLLSLGRPGDAVPLFQKAVKIKPNYHRARVNLGDALLAQGKASEALGCYEDVIAADPGDPDAYVKAAGIRWGVTGLRDVAVARSLASRALQLSPQPSISALELLGLTSAHLGKRAEAVDAFNRASVEAGKRGRPDIAKTFRERAEALANSR
jgi:tetratricopeptide (TPR) repeat protein